MTKVQHIVAGVGFLLSLGATQAKADTLTFSGPIAATYYNSFNETLGSGIAFSNAFSSETMAGIDELRDIGGSDSSAGWPDGSLMFGADFTGLLNAPAAGVYGFAFGTDDAGYLFIDGVQVAAQPGLHAFSPSDYSVFLSGGLHSFELQYDNAGGGGAVALFDPGVPEPATWALMLVGLGGLGAGLRSRRRLLSAAA